MCIDRFFRWVECIPLKDTTTQTVIDGFVLGWISRFGAPKEIKTDRGSQFTSHAWADLMRLLGTKHNTALSYSPHQNSLIERFNRTLKRALRAHESPNEWYEKLGFALLGLRSVIKEDL